MSPLTLTPVPGTDAKLRDALVMSGLPTEDLEFEGRSFLAASNEDGEIVGYSGVEVCGGNVLLRSVVVLPEHRGQDLGAFLVEETLASIGRNSSIYLATTSAAPFFEKLGFVIVDRAEVPADVMSTQQLSSICPATATVMKLTRPPN